MKPIKPTNKVQTRMNHQLAEIVCVYWFVAYIIQWHRLLAAFCYCCCWCFKVIRMCAIITGCVCVRVGSLWSCMRTKYSISLPITYVMRLFFRIDRPKATKKTIGKKSTHHLNFDMGLTIKSLTSWGEPHLNANHSIDESYEAKSFSVGLFFGCSVANATKATSMKLKFVDLFLHVICCRLSTAFEMLWAKFNY